MSNEEKEELRNENNETEASEQAEPEEAEGAPAEEDAFDEKDEHSREMEEMQNKLLRLQADYDNFRRRTKQEKEAAAKYKSQKLADSLLPALDNFERALMMEPESEEAKNLLQGMQMVYRQLEEALQSEHINVMETVGQPFDPHKHEAVMQVETDEYDSNIIVEELQKGYMLHDKVIRPAMVKVNA
ncbi:nucleotide exchange factor GrpE [Alkalicoccus luteus]|uniref:Protein GrpE n=1 Tax=Alkalicoccus luteus TaxID=1237094 RepID=A0A969TTP8_9BACI|nr:nucleotide exchange factor GrpE [Alkalicoccus luteus]